MDWRLWLPPVVISIFLVIVAQYDFLTFHTLAELFTVVVSFVMFALAWTTYDFSKNAFLIFLACGYFWIGSLDLMHTLVYKGMYLFVEGSADLSVQFWIGTRYLQAILLLVAPFVAVIKLNKYQFFLIFGVIAIGLTALILLEKFPVGFVEGKGLTDFKIYSEYLIDFILASALLALFRYGGNISIEEKVLIAASIVLMMCAELAFTFYVSVYGLSNLAGHIFKLFSFWFIFQAIVISNLKKPYRELIKEKEASDALLMQIQQHESRFEAMFSAIPDSVVFTDSNRRIIAANRGMERTFGYAIDDIIGKQTAVFYETENEFERQGRIRFNLSENLNDDLYEVRYRHKDGRIFVGETLGAKLLGENGETLGFIGIIRDISERKKTERTLQESEERFRTLYQQFPVGVSLEDYSAVKLLIVQLENEGVQDFRSHFKNHPDDLVKAIGLIRLLEVNETYLSLFGASDFEEYLEFEKAHIAINFENWFQYYLEEIAALAEGKVLFSMEVLDARMDGAPLDLNCITRIVKGREIDWSEIITTHEDTSERKHLEEQIRRSQKMEAIGQLTGGISHDFNNILTIIMGNLEILQKMLVGNSKALGRVNTALKGVKRGSDLTQKLLGISSKNVHAATLVSMNAFIRNMEDLLDKALTVAIQVEYHLSEDLWLVHVDSGDLQDAILNLALNARDAMSKGGGLVIETSNKVLDEDYVQHNRQGRTGEFVMLSMSDTGHGMTAEVKERVLEPFFSTKEEGKGTGLGLSMIYGFVQRSKGHIRIYSNPGEGTAIRIYLPRAQKEEEREEEKTIQAVLPRGSETILVVDDEADVVDIAVLHLGDLGFRTVTACNAKQALKVLRENPDIDLLFSDVVMPGGMNGYELALKALKDRPSLKVLLTSGFTKKREDIRPGDQEIYAKLQASVLNKPYDRTELAIAIRRTLDGEALPGAVLESCSGT